MPAPAIVAITTEPGLAAKRAAYRPIYFRVQTSDSPPVVYCDIYFGGVFYATLTKTVPATGAYYDFDIQEKAQEYLTYYLAPNGSTNFYLASAMFVECLVKFRASQIDSNGFIVPDATIPVQATDGSAAAAGTGTVSNIFYITNSTLQHENNPDLNTHIAAIRTALGGTWQAATYPMTHRPATYKLCLGDSDYYPLISTVRPDQLKITWTNKDGSTGNLTAAIALASGVPPAISVWYIPNGPKQLTILFPAIDWSLVASYVCQPISESFTMATYTTHIGCCCSADRARVHFRNSLGAIDAINFIKPEEEHFNASALYEKGLNYPLVKTDTGNERNNVRSNEKYTGLNQCYTDAVKDWLIEMLDSSKAFIEWTGIEGQSDSYLPITIQDSKNLTKKAFEAYFYDIPIEFLMGNENINLRN